MQVMFVSFSKTCMSEVDVQCMEFPFVLVKRGR